jgi:hypothetical protein
MVPLIRSSIVKHAMQEGAKEQTRVCSARTPR